MEEKLVSIIVPVYNVKKYVEACIDSIIKQDYKKLEIIVVDDGSTDGSGKLCDEIAKTDKRVKVIHKNNGGLSSARNAGIEKASGEYIAFVDSDDQIDKMFIRKLIDGVIHFGAEISVCRFEKFVDKPNSSKDEGRKESAMSGKDYILGVYDGSGYGFVAWNKLYKSTFFKEKQNRFPDGKLYEDDHTIFRIFYDCEKIVVLNDILYHYRERQGSIMYDKKMSEKNALDMISADLASIMFYNERGDIELLSKALSYCLRDILCVKASCKIRKYLMGQYRKIWRKYRKVVRLGIKRRLFFSVMYFYAKIW